MVTIKKYSNRRLYDTSESSYITQEELARKIRRGTDVRVVDAKTDEDLTQQVLAQIILESRGAAKLLPVPLLMRLIRMGDDALAEFFGQYMSWALELYLKFKEGYQTMAPLNPFAQMFGQNNPFAQMFNQGGTPWSGQPPWQEQQSDTSAPPPVEEPPEAESGDESSDEVAELRQEMDELKQMMRQMAAAADESPDDPDN